MPSPVIPGGFEQLSNAYDRAVAEANSSELHTGRTGASTRITDFVNRGSRASPCAAPCSIRTAMNSEGVANSLCA
jgi:hypothetical protein